MERRRLKVWLDDERSAPAGWVHVRTPEEAIELLRGGDVEEISLDHDLGLDVGERERTGYDVLLWIEREVAAGRARPPGVMRVHTGNAGAVRRMEQAIESIRRLADDKGAIRGMGVCHDVQPTAKREKFAQDLRQADLTLGPRGDNR